MIMSKRQRHYSPLSPTSLDQTELVKTTLDDDSTLMLIDKWLEHRQPHEAYYEWFRDSRDRRQIPNQRQILIWNKGEFDTTNIFCRTVDTGRLMPLHRMWTTHVYCHRSMQERKLPMLQVVFTMLPELLLLRGMHENCSEIYIIVTDLKRQEMDDVTEYFKLVSRYSFGRVCKPSIERQIQYEHMRISHTLHRRHRLPCFPQIDLTLRAIIAEKKPPFLILFSPQPTSYSQILFTHPSYVPDEEIFCDYPTGCPNPCCTEDCEMIRFPRRGLESASVLEIYGGNNRGFKAARVEGGEASPEKDKVRKKIRKIKERDMCNWIECDACFSEQLAQPSYAAARMISARSDKDSNSDGKASDARKDIDGDSGSHCSAESMATSEESHHNRNSNTNDGSPAEAPSHHAKSGSISRPAGQLCSKCKLVKYCSLEHQRLDWEEHKRVCIKMNWC
ncbi:hypothetical protein D9758_011574 [Tetrapyrgos nigripes]|uniref:MYND-type domain-containing protein n=1 Tax=Tetrapyrgos nigripes TaxID=182062 RepID=A0A8H5CNT6_9AGAR|nr:hypothetical protein D9758_011574 [Tetrapyrgos nigripes]